jgi:hypothetical protein
MKMPDFFKNSSIFAFFKDAKNNNSNINKENKNNNKEDECLTKFREKINNKEDECLTKFREKINNKEDEWKEAFNEYVDCKYKMFDKLKVKEKKIDERLQICIILSSALIPIVNVIIPIGEMEYIRIFVTTLLGFFVTILVGYSQIKKYHERWTTFKGVSRALEFEYLKLTKPTTVFSQEYEKNAYDNIISILQQEAKEIVSLFKDKNNILNNNRKNEGKPIT